VAHDELYYRAIETDKIQALRKSKGLFDKPCELGKKAYFEILWWKHNILKSFKNIHLPEVDIILHTDPSKAGWGITNSDISSGGRWSLVEQELHINVLELKALYIGARGRFLGFFRDL